MFTLYGDYAVGREELILLADGPAEEIALAAKRLQLLTPHFSKSEPPGALVAPISWAAVVQLAYTFGTAWRPQPDLIAWIDREAGRRTGAGDPLYHPPAGLVPYPWQREGSLMVANVGKVLFADDPGTGKTITALLGIAERWMRGLLPEPILVCCPASVIDSWVEAAERWVPHWRAVAWRGPRRGNLVGTAHLYVTSYDTARNDAPSGRKGPLNHLAPRSVVIDECHYIKTPDAKRSQAVRRIARDADAVIPMSGTPITHNAGNLWSSLCAMDAAAWPSETRYRERYLETAHDGEGYEAQVLGLHPMYEPEFRDCLDGQMRRIAKDDVLTELPDKVYSVRHVELPREWKKAYDEFEADMIAELPSHDGGPGQELSVMHVLSVINHLKQLACSPADVRIETRLVPDEDEWSPTFGQMLEKRSIHLDLKPPSWKVAALLEVLDERPGMPVLVFAPSRQLVMMAGQAAERHGRRVGYIVGGQSAGQRTTAVNAFQAGELDLICATTGAGGVGLTLTAASRVVFLQRPMSLVESIQAEDRAHRIGQTAESVEIIDIVAKGTIDTRIRQILRTHAGQLSELVQDPRIVTQLLGGQGL